MVVLNDDDAVVVVSFIDDGNYDLWVRHNQTNNNEPYFSSFFTFSFSPFVFYSHHLIKVWENRVCK
jgi:hypothetical protein